MPPLMPVGQVVGEGDNDRSDPRAAIWAFAAARLSGLIVPLRLEPLLVQLQARSFAKGPLHKQSPEMALDREQEVLPLLFNQSLFIAMQHNAWLVKNSLKSPCSAIRASLWAVVQLRSQV